MAVPSVNFSLLCSSPNVSADNTSALWLVEDRVSGQVTAAFLLLILVVGLPWNLLVVITIVKEKLYHQPTVILLLNLVLNDFIMLVYAVPVQIVTGFAGEFILGDTNIVRCRVCDSEVLNLLFSLMSIYTIAFMAFDRFLYIYKPLRYEKIITSQRTVVLLIILWAFITFSSFVLLNDLYVVFLSPAISCRPDFQEVPSASVLCWYCP